MTTAAFQSAFVRLVTDQEFRDSVRRGQIPPGVVDPVEREQLAVVAAQPGIAAMRVVYRGFRLNKILAMLPLTGRLLGEQRLSAELERFWKDQPSGSFYYVEEANRFCDFLWKRIEDGLETPYLRDVVLFEQASLRLQKAAGEGRELMLQIDLNHRPAFLEELYKGRVPAEVPLEPTSLLGVVSDKRPVRWFVLDPDNPLTLSLASQS